MFNSISSNKKKPIHSKNISFQDSKVDYAIISAMPEELDFFMNEFANLNYIEIKIEEFNFVIYDYQDNKILLVHTGMGTAFAASILTLIHLLFQPEYCLISGTAGGAKDGLQLRDVIIAEKAFEAEIQDAFTLLKDTPFESCLKHPVKNKYFPAHYSADPELMNIYNSLNFSDINTYKGTVVSSNAFPAPTNLFEKIKCFDLYSIDMETSAFYQIAWLLNMKVLAVRGISNVLNSDGSDDNIHKSDVKGSSIAAATVTLSILNKSISLRNKHQSSVSSVAHKEALELMKEYNLQPHPEGGYFAPIFKSEDTVKSTDTNRYNNESRSAGTSILYLLNKQDYSAWHNLKSDEIWHFYKGSPLNVYVIDKNGNLTTYLLGDPLKIKGATFQVCIKAEDYFAAENIDKTAYSLVGCTVSPGFEYRDFKLADKNALINAFPQHEAIINRFTHRPIADALPHYLK